MSSAWPASAVLGEAINPLFDGTRCKGIYISFHKMGGDKPHQQYGCNVCMYVYIYIICSYVYTYIIYIYTYIGTRNLRQQLASSSSSFPSSPESQSLDWDLMGVVLNVPSRSSRMRWLHSVHRTLWTLNPGQCQARPLSRELKGLKLALVLDKNIWSNLQGKVKKRLWCQDS